MMNKLRNSSLLFIGIYFLLGLVVIRWFAHNNFILGGDLSWPPFFSNLFRYTVSIWDDSVNAGFMVTRQLAILYPYALVGRLLELIIHAGPIIQLLIYYCSFVFSGIGMYLFSKQAGLKSLGAFIAGFVYMFGPYAAVVPWNPSYGTIFPFYAYLPLALYFVYRILSITQSRREEWFSIIVYSVAIMLTFIGASYSNPAFFLLFLFFTLCLFLHRFITTHERLMVFRRYVIFFVFYIFLNLFWLLPFIMNIESEYSNASNAPARLINDAETLKLNSVRLGDAFRSTGFWALQGEVEGNYYYDWHNNVFTWWYIIATSSLPIMALFPFLGRRRHRNQMLWVMVALLVFGIFLNAGLKMDGLWRQVAETIFHSDFLSRAYRAVYLKLGILIAFPLSFLVGGFFHNIEERHWPKKLLYVVGGGYVVAFLFTIGLPFLNGQIILSQGTILPAHNVRIPQEYYDFKAFDSRLQSDGRYFALPIPYSYNLNLDWAYGGFSGADFLRYFIKGSLINVNDDSVLLRNIIHDINNDEPTYYRWLRLLNAKSLFIHKDLNEKLGDYMTTRTTRPLSASVVLSNRYFDVYKFPESDYLPHIYIPNKQSIASSWSNISNIDIDTKSAPAIYTKDQNQTRIEALNATLERTINSGSVEFKKINPTHYEVILHSVSSSSATSLVFLENYHPGWKVFARPYINDVPFYLQSRLGFFKSSSVDYDAQASQSQIEDYIKNRQISTLGKSGTVRFVSTSSQGSIQNDNLQESAWYQSWIQKPVVSEDQHFVVNSYANAWSLPVSSICDRIPLSCHTNADGTRDVSLTIQFTPQRGFIIGGLISFSFLVIGCLVLIWSLFRRIRLFSFLRKIISVNRTQFLSSMLLMMWVFFIRLPLFSTALNFDENQYSYIAWHVLSGNNFYSTDWDNKPPLIHFLYMINSVLFGGLSVFTVRLFGLIYGIITVVVFYWLARYLFQRRFWVWFSTFLFATLFSHPVIQGQYSNTENFFVLWIILAFFMMIRNPEKAWRSYLCMGMAFILKPTTILTAIPLLIYHYYSFPEENRNIRCIGRVLKGAIMVGIPLGLFLTFFFFEGTFINAIDWIFLKNITHVSLGYKAESLMIVLMRTFKEVFIPTAIYWVLGLVGFFITVRRSSDHYRWVIAAWFSCAALSIIIGGWFFPHYFLEIVTPLVLLGSYAMHQFYQVFSDKWQQRGGAVLGIIIIFFGLFIVVSTTKFVIRERQRQRESLMSMQEQMYVQAGDYLRMKRKSDETLFVWDGSPQLYFLTNTHSPIRDIWKYPFLNDQLQYGTLRGWFTNYAISRARLEEYMNTSPPAYVAITVNYATIAQEYELNRVFFDAVFHQYVLEKVFGDILIYHRDDSAKQPIYAYVQKGETEDIVSEFNIVPGGGKDRVIVVKNISAILKSVKISLGASSWVFPFQGIERPLVLRGLSDLWYINFEPPMVTAIDRYTIEIMFVDGTLFTTKLHEYQYNDFLQSNPSTWQIQFPSDIYSDVVSSGNTEPSGIKDVVMKIADIHVPVREAKIIIGDHLWHGPMNGIDSPIIFQQNPQRVLFYFEPRDFRGGERGTIKLLFADNTVGERHFFLPKNSVWTKK